MLSLPECNQANPPKTRWWLKWLFYQDVLHRNLGITSVAAFPLGTYHRQLAVENFPEVDLEVEVKTLTGKCEPPPPRCSFARHLVGKMAIQAAHLLITKHQPVDTHLIN